MLAREIVKKALRLDEKLRVHLLQTGGVSAAANVDVEEHVFKRLCLWD